jgi:hypothetical protein
MARTSPGREIDFTFGENGRPALRPPKMGIVAAVSRQSI